MKNNTKNKKNRGKLSHFFYCLAHPFSYKNRASRKEYWSFVLFALLFYLIYFWYSAGIFSMINNQKYLNNNIITYILSALEILLIIMAWFIIPFSYYAVKIRRFHDRNISGWWVIRFLIIDLILLISILSLVNIMLKSTFIKEEFNLLLIKKLILYPLDIISHLFSIYFLTSTIILLIFLIYLLASIPSFVITVLKGTTGPNKYGDDPLKIYNTI